MLDPEIYKVECVPDRPTSGMWHGGPNPVWMTVEHIPTKMCVRVLHTSQRKARDTALMALELILDASDLQECSFPESLEEARHD